ncbi:MAG: hypothetical protein RI907_382 [Pseudomonadota bacterium]
MIPAAVFDVDGTLCATRSTTSLVWLRQQQHAPWRHVLWLASLTWRAPGAWVADRISRDLADRLVFGQFAGLDAQKLRADAQRCAQSLLLPACFPQALAAIAEHRRQGHRIVLLSGGIDWVLQPLADALGAELLGQRLVVHDGRCTGAYRRYAVLDDLGDQAARLSQAQAKAEALRRHALATGLDLSASVAYGDSVNDALMLQAVGRAVAVNPDRGLSRVAEDRRWSVQQWALPA